MTQSDALSCRKPFRFVDGNFMLWPRLGRRFPSRATAAMTTWRAARRN